MAITPSTDTALSGRCQPASLKARLILSIYQAIMTLALPIYVLVLGIRNSLQGKHFEGLTQLQRTVKTLGFLLPERQEPNKTLVWVHAVSLGEVNTARPMIEQLLRQGFEVLLTNTTATGYWRTRSLFGDQLISTPMVMDHGPAVQRFMNHFSPSYLVLVETEVWPTLIDVAHRRGLKVAMLNARLSERSAKRLAWVRSLSRYLFAGMDRILCQDADSKTLFVDLGAQAGRVQLHVNLKYLSALDSDALKTKASLGTRKLDRAELFLEPQTLVITAASTHDPEEQWLLTAFDRLVAQVNRPLVLILVPRHPERFEVVAKLLRDRQQTFCRRSKAQLPGTTPVFLADSLGELEQWYALSDVAFVGGSIAPIGGHTPMEAAKFALPIVMGQHTHKSQQMVNELRAANALEQVQNPDELFAVLLKWVSDLDKAKEQGQNGLRVLHRLSSQAQHQVDELLEQIQKVST